MSTLSRTKPLIGTGCRLLGSRNFHSSQFTAQPAARRSPRVARSQQSSGAIQVRRPYNVEESLPPVTLLNSARKSGVLSVEPEIALNFLRAYQALVGKSPSGWEKRLCTEHAIAPFTMTLLASILRRCPEKSQQSLARNLMLSASELGDKTATFEIVQNALRTGVLDKYRAPLQRLRMLAQQGNDPQAMTILGKALFTQHGDREALDWLRKATQPPTGSLDFDGAGEALVYEGRILLKRNDVEGAKAAFEDAALLLDDPAAFFHLSELEEPASSRRKVYLLKAASSGIVDAWHHLGMLELEEVQRSGKSPKSIEEYGMAREWLEVAATDGFGKSMIPLAELYRTVGREAEGLKWLEKAEGIVDVHDDAVKLRRQWDV